MTQLTNQLTEQYYAVEVPEDACGLEVYNNNLYGLTHPAMSVRREFAYLSPGNWQFLFTTKGMTEDQAAQVVEGRKEYRLVFLFKDYQTGKALDNATDSLQSLLRSKGMDTEKNYAILKKEP